MRDCVPPCTMGMPNLSALSLSLSWWLSDNFPKHFLQSWVALSSALLQLSLHLMQRMAQPLLLPGLLYILIAWVQGCFCVTSFFCWVALYFWYLGSRLCWSVRNHPVWKLACDPGQALSQRWLVKRSTEWTSRNWRWLLHSEQVRVLCSSTT